jgi:hypothetical protein
MQRRVGIAEVQAERIEQGLGVGQVAVALRHPAIHLGFVRPVGAGDRGRACGHQGSEAGIVQPAPVLLKTGMKQEHQIVLPAAVCGQIACERAGVQAGRYRRRQGAHG